jgi:hypothetical protein
MQKPYGHFAQGHSSVPVGPVTVSRSMGAHLDLVLVDELFRNS